MPRRMLALAALTALVVVTAGTAQSAQAPIQTKRLSAAANGDLRFNKTRLSARRGRVRVIMRNPSSSGKPHAIEVEGHGVEKEGRTVQPGGTSRVTVRLRTAGRYEFYCPVDGHKAAGMEGTLRVR